MNLHLIAASVASFTVFKTAFAVSISAAGAAAAACTAGDGGGGGGDGAGGGGGGGGGDGAFTIVSDSIFVHHLVVESHSNLSFMTTIIIFTPPLTFRSTIFIFFCTIVTIPMTIMSFFTFMFS